MTSYESVGDGRRLILTPDQRLRVFVSSTLQELAPERAAARAAIQALHLAPVMFELGARPHAPRDLYRAYLEQSHVFVGIYWQKYGWVAPGEEVSGLEDEYNLSGGRPKLIYVKEPAPDREPRLKALLDRVRVDDRASYKHFDGPDELSRLIGDDLALMLTERFALAASGAPAARAATGDRKHMPAPMNPVVGRDREAAEVRNLLLGGDARLVTLLGPAGVGKTRLAILAASGLDEHFRDGVHFVPLAEAKGTADVAAAIGEVLGLVESPVSDPVAALVAGLRGKELLLVLDNLEQAVEAAPALAETLAACPGVEALVTSRAALRLSGEHEYAVYPLEVPPAGGRLTPQELAGISAVQLFVERARAVRPGFTIDAGNAGAVAEICRRLEGIPLSIELAAARVRLLPPQVLVKRLESRLELLTGGPRDLPDRQRTLRGAIDWSYDLLGDGERRLLARLATFPSGATLEAVEAVCGQDEPQLLERLFTLIDNSLLQQGEDSNGEPRVRMLATVREYAAERLQASGEWEEVRDRQALYATELAEASVPGLSASLQEDWLKRLDAEHDNLRWALSWAVSAGSAVLALRLCVALRWFWELRGHFREGREWLRAALGLAGEPASTLRSAALNALGVLAWRQGDPVAAREALSAALEARRSEGGAALAGTLQNLGNLSTESGEHDAARTYLAEALDIRRNLGERIAVARLLVSLANLSVDEGDYSGAARAYRESLEIMEASGSTHGAAVVRANQAVLARYRGNLTEARQLHEESLPVLREVGDQVMTANGLEGLGRVHEALGNAAQARALFEESLAMARSVGYGIGSAIALADIGFLARDAGDAPAARSALGEALVEAKRTGYRRGETRALIGLGSIAADSGAAKEARGLVLEALSAARGAGDLRAQVAAHLILGGLASEDGAVEAATSSFAEAVELCERIEDRDSLARALDGLAASMTDPMVAATLLAGASCARAATQQVLSARDRAAREELIARVATELQPEVLAAANARGREMSVRDLVALARASTTQ